MKATIQTKPFLEALQSASIAAATGRSLPILTCALVEVAEGRTTVTCDCLDARVTATVEEVSCEKPFSFCVGVKLLQYALRGETAELSLTKQRLTIKSGGDTALNTLATDEFPPESNYKAKATDTTDGLKFLSAIKAALASASTDTGRHTICGVHWEQPKESMVGTNGSRLCVAPLELPCKDSFTLPSAHAKHILSCFAADDELSIGLSEGSFSVSANGKTLWGKLIEGNYPNYLQVIPESKPFSTVEREPLIASLKSLVGFTDEMARVKITPNGEWNMSAAKDGNESSVTLDASQKSKVEPFGVNAQNVLSLLQNWTCDEVDVTMDGNCLLLHPKGKTGQLGVSTLLRV